MLLTYYFTFGQSHCDSVTGRPLNNYYVTVTASDRAMAIQYFRLWSLLHCEGPSLYAECYDSATFEEKYFPQGMLDSLNME